MSIYNLSGNELTVTPTSDYPKTRIGRCLHRGRWGSKVIGESVLPENSAPAFYHAGLEGSGWECDMQHCSDGIIVMGHNTPMDGTLNGESITDRIDETAYDTVSRVVRTTHPIYGKIGYCRLEDCLKIAYYFGVDIVLENKAYLALSDTASIAAQAVVDAGMSGHVMYNGNSDTLKKTILTIDPKARFHFSYDTEVDLTAFSPDHIVRTVNISVCTPEIVRAIRAEGSQLYIWSVGISTAEDAIAYHPDYIEFGDTVDGKTLTTNHVNSLKFINNNI